MLLYLHTCIHRGPAVCLNFSRFGAELNQSIGFIFLRKHSVWYVILKSIQLLVRRYITQSQMFSSSLYKDQSVPSGKIYVLLSDQYAPCTSPPFTSMPLWGSMTPVSRVITMYEFQRFHLDYKLLFRVILKHIYQNVHFLIFLESKPLCIFYGISLLTNECTNCIHMSRLYT